MTREESAAYAKKLYLDQNLTLREIASRMGWSVEGTRGRLQAAGVVMRPAKILGTGWTDERVELLKKLWQDGLSAGQIAKQLGEVTRNAVIGKLSRLGLLGEREQASAPRFVAEPVKRANPQTIRPELRTFNPIASPAPAPRPARSARTAPIASTTPKVIADLERCECRWHVGKDPGLGNGDLQLFCAKPTDLGQPYCETHRKRVYQKTRTPEQKAADEARTAKMRAAKGHKLDINSHVFRSSMGRPA